jgi:hypothetical protein
MQVKEMATESAAKSVWDLAVWGVVPSVIGLLVLSVVLFWLRKEIRQVLRAIVSRLRQGDSLKIAGFEVGAAYGLVANPGDFDLQEKKAGVSKDDGGRSSGRADIYRESKGIMLVHQLQRSIQDGQIYDVLIYVLPHQSAAPGAPRCSLASVASVEYFFGSFWHDKIFCSRDRSRGFPVVTSAYGPFLCTAKIDFIDGTVTTVSRYIDFEMGKFAPSPRLDGK